MGNPQAITNEVKGGALIAELQRDIAERVEEVLPDLVKRIEETRGFVPQSVTVSVKYKPGDGDEKPDVFEIFAKLANSTNSTVRALKVAASGSGGKGPIQLSMFAVS